MVNFHGYVSHNQMVSPMAPIINDNGNRTNRHGRPRLLRILSFGQVPEEISSSDSLNDWL